jgi:hypothetical protein
MKAKEERKEIEKLLETVKDNIGDEGNVLPGLDNTEILKIDIDDIKKQCEKEARIMINTSIKFILDTQTLKSNSYVKNKLEVDVLSLSGMIYQLRCNEAMQKALMEQVAQGALHARYFEVFGQLSKIIGELNKQTLATVEAIKMTYKEVKNDIREKEFDSLPQNKTHMLTTGNDGSLITLGSKDLINKAKNNRAIIQDIEPVDSSKE